MVDQCAETVVNPYFVTCKINPIGFEDVVLVFGRGEDIGEDYKVVEFVDGLGGGVGTEFVVDDECKGDGIGGRTQLVYELGTAIVSQ